jgi:LDH2 family malate/lactate/ureidoglycolate dehydrogenase
MKVDPNELRDCIREILTATGEKDENIEIAAELMLRCDARGIQTHGSHLLNPIYDRRKQGQLNFPTELEILSDSGAVALINGNDGLGQVAAFKASTMAIDKAKKFGIGAVLIRNTNNVGALGLYSEMVAKEGMFSIFCSNASPAMAPWGGMEQFLGTQPFSIGIFTGKDFVFSADMATSEVARGKIRQAAREGKNIPESWALDKDGNPTTDPMEAIKGVLLPIGGAKGSAIALSIDILAGMISGSYYAPNVRAIHYPEGEAGVGCAVIAIDIEHFMPMDEFKTHMDGYIQSIKTMKKARGVDEIFLPGENSRKREKDSMDSGIDLSEKALESLDKILEDIGSERRMLKNK